MSKDRTAQWMQKNLKRKTFTNNISKTSAMIYVDSKKNINEEDTKIRIGIRKTIVKSVNEGKSILQIIDCLNSVDEYKRYNQFFESWINHYLEKYLKTKKNDIEEMER